MVKDKLMNIFTLSVMGGIGIVSLPVSSLADTNTFSKMTVNKNIRQDVSGPLREMQGTSHFSGLKQSDLNKETKSPLATQTLVHLNGFQGMGIGLGNYQVTSASPDVNGSVGMLQYVQYVNSDLAVFDKASGQVAIGFPKPANSIWSGFGGACETNSTGRMTIKYDQLAHRWIITQAAASDPIIGPFYQCAAVSTSEDATDNYFRYAFPMPAATDYSRLGLWPDAYYLALNFPGGNKPGPHICALERDKMLLGQSARVLCFHLGVDQSGPLLPADLEGKLTPPVGNPEYAISLNAPSTVFFYKFHIDFSNLPNSTLTYVIIPVENFNPSCLNSNGNVCAIQPDTTNRLDLTSDRLITRLAYRQFSDHGSMVTDHTIQGPSPKFSPAIRWYEFRVNTSIDNNVNPVLHQMATLAPDSKNRFQGSVAMDRFGNIALGYNVSSSLVHPSPELAYHNYTDGLNNMSIQPLVTGTGSQINNVTDWTSATKMVVDPVDQCTFWYTNEYLQTTGSMNWSTFILNFKLSACK